MLISTNRDLCGLYGALARDHIRIFFKGQPQRDRAHRNFCCGDNPRWVYVLHIEVKDPRDNDPAGQIIRYYSGNLPAPQGRATWELPLEYNDATGLEDGRTRFIERHGSNTEI
jgi:hypothetical protein